MIKINSNNSEGVNYFLTTLFFFLICFFPAHDLGVDKLFLLLLVIYPIIWVLVAKKIKFRITNYRTLYFLIALLLCGYAFFLPNDYSLIDFSIFYNCSNGPILFLWLSLYVILAKTTPKEISLNCKIILAIGLLLSLISIAFRINPDFYTKVILPHLVIPKDEILADIKLGYGMPIGGSITYIAFFTNICLFVCFALEHKPLKKREKILLKFIEFIYLLANLCQGRRSETLCLAITLFVLYIGKIKTFNFKQFCKLFSKLFLVLVFIIIFYFTFSNFGMLKRFTNTSSAIEKGASFNAITTGRAFLWYLAFDKFLQSPILGNGWKFFPYYSKNLTSNGKALNVHNTYLQFLCETGIIGSLLMLIPIFILYIKTLKLYRKINFNNSNSPNNSDFIFLLCLTISLGIQTLFILISFMDNHFYGVLYMCLFTISIILANFAKTGLK